MSEKQVIHSFLLKISKRMSIPHTLLCSLTRVPLYYYLASFLQVASKIQPSSGSPSEEVERNGSGSSVKRPFSSVSPSMENEPDTKRMAAAVAAAAAAAAANAGDPFGALRSPGMPGSRAMMGLPPSMINMGSVSTEEVAVPDKMVGLSKLLVNLQSLLCFTKEFLQQLLVVEVNKSPVSRRNREQRSKWPPTVPDFQTERAPSPEQEKPYRKLLFVSEPFGSFLNWCGCTGELVN